MRYTSFLNSYPKDSLLPACTLSQYGFYYDETAKKLRCIECTFQYENLYAESLGDVLSQHYKFNRTCEQAKASLDMCVDTIEFKRTLSQDATTTIQADLGNF